MHISGAQVTLSSHLLFRNLKNGKFERVGAAPGSAVGRRLARKRTGVGDLDGDGRLDAGHQ